jgi:hypothetical protein
MVYAIKLKAGGQTFACPPAHALGSCASNYDQS